MSNGRSRFTCTPALVARARGESRRSRRCTVGQRASRGWEVVHRASRATVVAWLPRRNPSRRRLVPGNLRGAPRISPRTSSERGCVRVPSRGHGAVGAGGPPRVVGRVSTPVGTREIRGPDYGVGLAASLVPIVGALESGPALTITLGLWRRASYGLGMLLHAVSVLSSWRQLLDRGACGPGDPRIISFWLGSRCWRGS